MSLIVSLRKKFPYFRQLKQFFVIGLIDNLTFDVLHMRRKTEQSGQSNSIIKKVFTHIYVTRVIHSNFPYHIFHFRFK